MLGNFAPMRDLLCALWRERQREREGDGCSVASNRTGFKKIPRPSSITCGDKHCLLRRIPPVDLNTDILHVAAFFTREAGRKSQSVSYCHRKRGARANVSLLRTGPFWSPEQQQWTAFPQGTHSWSRAVLTHVAFPTQATFVCVVVKQCLLSRGSSVGARDAREEQVQPGGRCGGLEGAPP